MKQRFSSLDLQVIAHELSATITNYRLSNIYDITSRIFLLKFAKPESKHLLLIDSGFRCHLTTFSRGTAGKQSSFVTKLRKCLRTRRCTKVQQIGTDRVLEFEFSPGDYRLYLEFYAGGNVVLVGAEGTIIAVLRDVKGGEGGVGECKVGAKYEVSTRTAEGGLRERITEALEASLKDEDAQPEVANVAHQGAGKKFKKKKKKGEEVVKKILSSRMPEFSPTLIEHCFLVTGVNPDAKAEEVLADDRKLTAIVNAFEEAEKMIKGIMADVSGTGIKGYIIAKAPRPQVEQIGGYKKDKKDKKGVSFGTDDTAEPQPKPISFGTTEAIESEQPEKIQEEGEAKGMVYDDFFPFLPLQYLHASGVKTIECDGYNHTVDTFFSSIESQKSETRISTMKENAIKRLDAARTDHAKRVEGLRTLQEINTAKAQAIEANLDRVEEVIASVNGLIAQGMDWVAMGQLIEIERKRGNAVAELIKLPLKLSENTVTITLGEPDFEEESDDEESADETDPDDSEEDDTTPRAAKKPAKTLDIDIDLSLTGYANASSYFTQKKVLLVKESKTIQSSSTALKSTEKKIQVALKKALKQEKDILRPVRNQVWFEKFLFFISSDGYLVLGGRDFQQSEILYRRYFRRGDVYVSADVEGAAMVIIKNNPTTPNAPIPPSTLNQAGTLSVATSKAWDSKIVMSAWWVPYEQVGKTVGGVYLNPGLFDIKGKKNFLPPAQLVLGYGILWYVDEESRKRHGKHRVEEEAMKETATKDEKIEVEGEDEAEEAEEADEGEKGEDGEESDEEFPDTQIELAEETEEKEPEEVEESEDEEFPDTEVQEKDSEPENEPATPEANEGTAPPAPDRADTPTGSKHMSSKERRELKKARAAGRELPTSIPTSTPKDPKNKEKPTPVKPEPQQPAQVRGKKGKQKKIASKYAHQDEEDRALAMELLGSASARAKAEDAAALKAAKEAELAFQKARRKEQHARASRRGLEAEEARRRENPDEEDEEEDITTKIPLDSFIGTPMPGDNLLAAIPVCAPWGAMGKFKYKTKMQPGSVKKGKAVKDVVSRWLTEGEKKMDMKSVDTERMWPGEIELIKGWKEAEIINCVGVSKVKVFGGSTTASGGKGGSGKRGGRGSKKR